MNGLKSVIIIFIFSRSLFSQPDWEWISPYPQGNYLRAMAQLPSSNVMFFVGLCGTIIRRDFNKESWNVQHLAGGVNSDLQCIKFVDGQTGFTCGIDDKILKTEDSGTSWQVIFDSPNYEFTDMVWLDTNVGYVVTENGIILKTINGGKQFDTVFMNSNYHFKKVIFNNPNEGLVIGNIGLQGVIIKTTDGGKNWIIVIQLEKNQNLSETFSDMIAIDNQHIIALGVREIFYQSQNIRIIFKSDDYGYTWREIFSLDYPQPVSEFLFSLNDYLYIYSKDGNLIYSPDIGNSWYRSEEKMPKSFQNICFYDNLQGFAFSGRSIYKTLDGGKIWENLTKSVLEFDEDFKSISIVDKNTAYLAGNRGIVYKTENSFESFDKVDFPYTSFDFESIQFLDKDKGFLTDGTKRYLISTLDSGLNWNLEEIMSAYALHDVCFINSETGFLADLYGILKTSDGGVNWQKFTDSNDCNCNRIQFIDQVNGFVFGNEANYSVLFTTINCGLTWDKKTISENHVVSDGYFFNPDTGLIVGGMLDGSFGKSILKTTDGGEYWKIVCQSNDFLERILFVNDSTGYAIGGGYIYKTTNQGENWELEQFYTFNGLNDIAYDEANENLYIVGSNGLILTLKFKDDNFSSEETNLLIQNYPNPCNQYTNICFQLSDYSNIRVAIYDIQGRLVQNFISGLFAPDYYEYVYSTKKLSCGLYIIQLKSENKVESKKMIILR